MSRTDRARLQRERDRRDAAILSGCERVIDELGRLAGTASRDKAAVETATPQARHPDHMAAFEAEVLDPDSAIVDALAAQVVAMPSDAHRGPVAWHKPAARDFLLDVIAALKTTR